MNCPHQLARLGLALLMIGSLCACNTIGERTWATGSHTVPFDPEFGEMQVAVTGGTIALRGTTAARYSLELPGGFSGTIPGAYGIPFDFRIGSTTLIHEFNTKKHRYYVAPQDQATASHSMLGVVVSPGDMIGVRIAHADRNDREWFVDNSIHNGQETVWTRPITPEDRVRLVPGTVEFIDDTTRLTQITYTGISGGQLHFDFIEHTGMRERSQAFVFDLDPSGEPTLVGIFGYIFEVVEVDNAHMQYRWLNYPEEM